MPKRIETPLTARQVATAKPGIHADGGCLYLRVRTSVTGSGRLNKAWVFRFGRGGKYSDMGLGSVDDLSLAEARAKAKELRRQLADDIDPAQHRKAKREAAAVKLPTFDQVADEYIEAHKIEWRGRNADAWRNSIRDHVSPAIGRLPVRDITTEHVLAVLRPLWSTRPNTGDKVRGRIEMILDRAKTMELRTGDNPARWDGHLQHLLAKVGSLRKEKRKAAGKSDNHEAIKYGELPSLVGELRQSGTLVSLALEFTCLTATRSGEVRLAQWSEFDLDAATWKIPADRMKAKRDHIVPLSDRCVEILQNMRERGEGRFVFGGHAPLGVHSMLKRLRTLTGNPTTTVHGLRSAFRVWGAEATSFDSELLEYALAHKVGDATRQAYDRPSEHGGLRDKRIALMAAWSDYLAGKHQADATGKVVQFAKAG
jgi:integrase